jgi:hypothetical protein
MSKINTYDFNRKFIKMFVIMCPYIVTTGTIVIVILKLTLNVYSAIHLLS